MAIVFPTALLRPGSTRPALIGQTVGGGTTLVGPEQIAELSGGGWWTLDYDLGDRPGVVRLKLIRALLMQMQGGASEIVMPFVDEPQAPWPGAERGPILTPFSDGSTFSDGGQFSQPRIVFTLVEAIAENAGEAIVTRAAGGDLIGGEFFTLVHAGAGARAYCIDSLEQTGPDTFAIGFGPPARGAAAAGDLADFQNPRCTMKQLAAGEAWPTITRGWKAASSLRFVESFDYLAEA